MRFSHYGNSLKLTELEHWLEKAPSNLMEVLEQFKQDVAEEHKDKRLVPVFVYRGMSGVSHATALALAWRADERSQDLPVSLIYVRKPEEVSHGERCEYCIPTLNVPYNKDYGVLVFVDDFISSGDTRSETLRDLHKFMNGKFAPSTRKDIWNLHIDKQRIITAISGDTSSGSSYPKIMPLYPTDHSCGALREYHMEELIKDGFISR